MADPCGSGSMKVDKNFYQILGLQSNHAYSVLDVRLVASKRLVILRNPSGKFLWKSAWSDYSQEMQQPGMRERLQGYGADEGIFWMDFTSFMKYYFDSVDLCRLNHDWSLTKN